MHAVSKLKNRHRGETGFTNDGTNILGYIALTGSEYELTSIDRGGSTTKDRLIQRPDALLYLFSVQLLQYLNDIAHFHDALYPQGIFVNELMITQVAQ